MIICTCRGQQDHFRHIDFPLRPGHVTRYWLARSCGRLSQSRFFLAARAMAILGAQ